MCFSTTASFTASAVLFAVGAASIGRNSSRSHRVFAGIPLIFSVQQAAEGAVWWTMDVPAHAMLQRIAVDVFLGIALVVWPSWVAFSLRLVEQQSTRRRGLTALCWFGLCVSVSSVWLLTRWQPVAVTARHSIQYNFPGPGDTTLHVLLVVAYAVTTIVPFFVSTLRVARTMGGTLLVSIALTIVIQHGTLTSVWCFFAAILSGLVFVAVEVEHRSGVRLRAESLAPTP